MAYSINSDNTKKSNKYSDKLDTQVREVQNLVNSNTISPRLGKILVSYLIKKDVKEVVKETLEITINNNTKDKLLMFGYDRKKTKYM